MNGMNKIMP